jgi:hypothetical protein
MVELAKLTDYCLDQTHPSLRHKGARVFSARLGVLLRGAAADIPPRGRELDAAEGAADGFGRRFTLYFVGTGPKGSG